MQESAPITEETEESREGTAVHEYAAWVLNDEFYPQIGGTMANGIVVTEAMVECAEVYIQEIGRLNTRPFIEQRLDLSVIHPDCFGTPDAMYYDTEAKRLYIWDYKHGYGIVEPEENAQLIAYAAGAMDYYKVHDFDITVVLTIVQPRAPHPSGPVRSWRVKGEELRPYINPLANAANANMSGAGQCKAGQHCRNCKALSVCHTGVSHGMAMLQTAHLPITVQPTPEYMGQMVEMCKWAEKLFGKLAISYEEQLKNFIMSGGVVEGWTLEQKFGNKAWNRPIEEVIELGDLMGVDLRKPAAAITPTQAKKAGLAPELIAAYSHTPSSGVALKRADDTKIKRIFA